MIETNSLTDLAALASPLPPAPEGEVFTDSQWKTLLAICEVFVPQLKSNDDSRASTIDSAISELKPFLSDDVSPDLVRSYLEEGTNDDFKETVRRKMQLYVPAEGIKGLAFIMSTLNTRAGSYLMTGSTTLIHEQHLPTRTTIVCNWSKSYLAPLRAIHSSLSGLTRSIYLQQSKTLPKVLDFPDVPKHIERSPGYDYKFQDFSDATKPTTISVDVIIVGSGCGAGVTASHLSRAGLKCLVLEKSYHYPSTHFPMELGSAGENLMEGGGFLQSDDNSLIVAAGSTFGGGGTVNWSASLQPQHFVREDWASDGLTQFLSAEFQDCLDTVCERMGVPKSTDAAALSQIEHSKPNAYLFEGARRLGLESIIVPQNTAGKRHFCGHCGTGCASATKQGPANCWFPDAAAHGCEFIEGCFVEEILFSEDTASASKKKATGVRAVWTSRDRKITRTLTITAPRIIVASGSLNSPLLLLRSKLTNPRIGSHLHLHPVTFLFATYPERIDPWDGPILTAAVTSLENLDGKGHGAKIEVMCATPAYACAARAWRPAYSLANNNKDYTASAIDFKVQCAKHAHSIPYFSMQRDQDPGRVYIDPSDPTRRRIRIKYTPSTRDKEGLKIGLIAAARIAYATGAVEIHTNHMHATPFKRSSSTASNTLSINDEAFEAWLAETKKFGIDAPGGMILGSAHQMGTCRMSSSPDTGVVDGRGRVWGCEGLWVADASVLPSASGVNPMVSTMGVAEWISRGIVKDLKGGDDGKEI